MAAAVNELCSTWLNSPGCGVWGGGSQCLFQWDVSEAGTTASQTALWVRGLNVPCACVTVDAQFVFRAHGK